MMIASHPFRVGKRSTGEETIRKEAASYVAVPGAPIRSLAATANAGLSCLFANLGKLEPLV